jgi:hypothetical protein
MSWAHTIYETLSQGSLNGKDVSNCIDDSFKIPLKIYMLLHMSVKFGLKEGHG